MNAEFQRAAWRVCELARAVEREAIEREIEAWPKGQARVCVSYACQLAEIARFAASADQANGYCDRETGEWRDDHRNPGAYVLGWCLLLRGCRVCEDGFVDVALWAALLRLASFAGEVPTWLAESGDRRN